MEQIPKPDNPNSLEEYKAKMGFLLDSVSVENFQELSSVIQEKKNSLLKKYGDDATKYRLYHALAWSSPTDNQEFIAEDFPGEDSIAQFIDNLQIK